MNTLNKYAALIGACSGAFAVVAAIAGWIWGAAVLATRLDTVQATVVTMAGKVDQQGAAIARIEGRLEGVLPSRIGSLTP
jgi:hypothetical protein